MNNLLDKALKYYGENNINVKSLHIGAMDGILFDEIIDYKFKYENIDSIYIEPIPYLFERLKNNIKNKKDIFINVAIANYDGEVEMIYIDQDKIDNGLLHKAFYGMSTILPARNGLKTETDAIIAEKYGKKIKVKCITYKTLLKEYRTNECKILNIDVEGYDYEIFSQIEDINNFELISIEYINLTDEEKEKLKNILTNNNYKFEIKSQNLHAISKNLYEKIKNHIYSKLKKEYDLKNNKITLVTGLWDINKESLNGQFKRSFDNYLENFKKLLTVEENMIIYGEENLKEIIFSIRNHENTQFIVRNKDWFKSNFYNEINQIRNKEEWKNQTSWLPESPQCKLEYYNPIVMSKVFLLNDAKILDKFNSNNFFWIDAGITHTVNINYLTKDKILKKIENNNKINFITFPYKANQEIHGFNYKKMCEISGVNEINLVCRGGFFGGPKHLISEFNAEYYDLLRTTLQENLMGTEESLFTIMYYKDKENYKTYQIEENGLIYKFFEDLKNLKKKYMM